MVTEQKWLKYTGEVIKVTKKLKELICNEKGVITVADTILIAAFSILIGIGIYLGIINAIGEGFNSQDSEMKEIKGGG